MSEQVIPCGTSGQSGQAVLCKADNEASHSDLCTYIEELRDHTFDEMPLLEYLFPRCSFVNAGLCVFFADFRKMHGDDQQSDNDEDARNKRVGYTHAACLRGPVGLLLCR